MSESIVIQAGGRSFTARAAGPEDGALVLLLHGFPDGPETFDHQLKALADGGYRAVAPTMRGYEPSSQPADDDHSLMALANDVVAWIDDLGAERAHIVGHDWGAAVAYVVAAHHGDRCHTVTTLAIPPLARIPGALRRVPRQLLLSWYMTFFQLRWVAERALRARNWALLRWFWPRWSPGFASPSTLVPAFDQPGVLRSALAYYRQNATPPLLLGIKKTPAMTPRPYGAPMLLINGDRDGCMDARLYDHTVLDEDYPAGVRRHTVAGTGHFLHLEQPAAVSRIILDFLDHTP